MNDKKDAKNIWSKDLVNKDHFGYRVAHHRYLLTYYPGQDVRISRFLVNESITSKHKKELILKFSQLENFQSRSNFKMQGFPLKQYEEAENIE